MDYRKSSNWITRNRATVSYSARIEKRRCADGIGTTVGNEGNPQMKCYTSPTMCIQSIRTRVLKYVAALASYCPPADKSPITSTAIFSDRQPRQDAKVLRRFRHWLRPHHPDRVRARNVGKPHLDAAVSEKIFTELSPRKLQYFVSLLPSPLLHSAVMKPGKYRSGLGFAAAAA